MKLNLLHDIHLKMNHHRFLISYMGTFSQGILRSMMNVLERKLNTSENDVTIKNKIFHFMVECVQNICAHENGKENGKFIFLIGKDTAGYTLYSAGIFKKEKAEKITSHLNFINDLGKEKMKETLYKELLSDKVDPDKMLMLSLLDISKRTGQKLMYEVKDIDSGKDCYVSFSTIIGEK